MERRPYFIAGDLGTSLVVGTLSGLGTLALVSDTWNLWMGMFAGMALGMLVAGVLGAFLFQIFFGALEVMIPAALSGMTAGMVVGMLACAASISESEAALLGAGCGLVSLAFVYGMNAYLTREGHSWTS